MKNKVGKQHDLLTYSPRVLTLILSVAAVGITLLVLPFSHTHEETVQEVLPSATPAPTPTAAISSLDIVLSSTPAPKQATEYYPKGAMDLVVNDTVICTLPNGEQAAALPQKLLQYWAEQPLEKNECLVSARIDAKMTVTAPSGEGVFMTEEEALLYLEQNPSLLPVSRTIRTIDVEETALNDQEITSDALPSGMTIVRKLERPSYMLFYTDREYEGSTLLSKNSAEGFLIGSQATGRITETGAEPSPTASPKSTPAPGSRAKECAVSLSAPVKGTVSARFGRSKRGIMRYGIDLRVRVGTAVNAPGNGTVVYCGPRGNLGNVIEIRHEDTGFVSRLIGLGRSMNVELYQRVKKGDRLGKAAAAKSKTDAILRYELIRDGVPVDPLLYLK